MAKIARDSDVVEILEPPPFSIGDRLRARVTVRNDGTFAGKEIGDVLARKGEEGFVVSIGTFLQQFYIYGIEFLETGHRVGMKRRELEAVEPPTEDDDDLPLPVFPETLQARTAHDRSTDTEISVGPAGAQCD